MTDLNHLSDLSDDDLLRAAIRYEYEHFPDTADFAVGQMYSGTVQGDPAAERVWAEETAPEQVELDLHLDGAGVRGHATRADKLATFVAGVNDATKAIVRDRLHLSALNRNLLVHGVGPGSVRVVLRADTPLDRDGKHVPLGGTSQFAASPDSEALRIIARLFTNASSSAPAVGSDVRDLPIKARRGLLRSTSAMKAAGWDIAGQIRQRGLGSTDVAFTQAGAAQLASELKNYDYDTETTWAIGTIDGFRRSLGSLYFTPAGTKSPLAVNVSDPDTLAAAARLAAEEEAVVRVLIETVRALSGEESTRVTTSRSLLQIERAAESLPYPE
jgi:hypothetical protein